ncbi:hypothetical protein TrispH2_009760 [Trichoplax sp. H2]|nr:hypothetical protein TrispH2_009760 [Trichoplax sp. H2]|eukprot:RDD37450.1 hypothetical protein TrispH2_009760 [Trichoplax sp. H2]
MIEWMNSYAKVTMETRLIMAKPMDKLEPKGDERTVILYFLTYSYNRFAQYKSTTLPDQHTRRQKELERQKRKRSEAYNLLRHLEDEVTMEIATAEPTVMIPLLLLSYKELSI